MTNKNDWIFRADHLEEAAMYLEAKAGKLMSEAERLRGLAEQSLYIAGLTIDEPAPAIME
jgi:hypothetical protein